MIAKVVVVFLRSILLQGFLNLNPLKKASMSLTSLLLQPLPTAHVLVTSSQPSDEELHVNTVRENFEGFTFTLHQV
jgi:hypothetical protein